MIAGLRERGEDEARGLARDFDRWDGPIVVEESAVKAARRTLAPTVLDDITEAHRNIRSFARAQRESLQPFEVEISPGLRAGHRLVRRARSTWARSQVSCICLSRSGC